VGDRTEEKNETFDISQCKGSEEYFSAVAYQIPVIELYRIIDSCCNSEENIFCPILIKIESR